MEETQIKNSNSDQFFDALDEFSSSDEETPNTSQIFPSKSIESEVSEVSSAKNSPKKPYPRSFSGNHRRRASNRSSKSNSSSFSTSGANFTSNLSSDSLEVENSPRNKFLQFLEDHKRVSERFDSSFNENQDLNHRSDRSGRKNLPNHEISTASSLNKGRIEEITVSDSLSSILENERIEKSEKPVEIKENVINPSLYDDPNGTSSRFLVLIAGLVIKAIGFQLVLLISFVTFPIWLIHHCYKLVTEPFHSLNRAKERGVEVLSRIYGILPERIHRQSIGKLAKRFGLGCFWSVYVCIMLAMLLGFAFVLSSILIGKIVEKPIRMTEVLNFDYTMENPVARVPIAACEGFACDQDCREKFKIPKRAGDRLVPANHRLQVTVSLTLPESDYNRKLGVFQVKVEFLSANGVVTARSSHPCMLRFKSPPLRYAETLLRSAPLLAGYSSESQILKIRMAGFTEGAEPTACIGVTLEHRAEHKFGAGIPEIYAASLLLESELPLFKWIIWIWKRTLFIWASMGIFIAELLLIMVCCRPVIFPSSRPVDVSPNRR